MFGPCCRRLCRIFLEGFFMKDVWDARLSDDFYALDFSDRLELDYRRYARRLEQEEIA